MKSSGHNSHLFRWKRLQSADKTPAKHDDIDQWRKRVEEASEFAVSEVFFRKKTDPGSSGLAVPLQNSDQLRDHDDAYSEAQALLGDWLGTKLRLELEADDEDALRSSAEKTQPAAPAAPTHSNFDDLYKCLAEEEEESAVNSVLQDLMEQELLDSGMMEQLSLDDGEARKKLRNPILAMEARRQQVRENGARRRAEQQRRRREEEARREARKEAGRREREEEAKKTLERRRQEEMVQREMVRLRCQMEERRVREQLGRQREREKEAQSAVRSVQSTPALPSKQQESERLRREQEVQMKNHVRNLKCLHRHFSGWHSAVMERRLRTGKAVALCDWRRQLRAWRAWRTVAWAERERREVARTEEALRMENRQVKLAAESDRRRLLRRCLNAWQLWRRVEKVQRELAARQQETKQKMAALLTAASTGKLQATGAPADQPITAPPAPPSQSQETDRHRSDTLAPRAFMAHLDQTPVGAVPRPSQPWQVTRRHAAPDAAELCEARRRLESGAVAGRFESRHAAQQRIIAQQRKLLKEQQEQIARLKGEQDMMGLELEMEKAAQLTQLSARRGSRPKSCSFDPKEQSSAPKLSAGPGSRSAPPRQTRPHPIITEKHSSMKSFWFNPSVAKKHSKEQRSKAASQPMEGRARRREERRREIEELKRRKEEEKLAEMKAAEERRQREEEEEKRRAAEKRREETRLEREREEEKRRQQELTRVARQHRHRSLLSRRGLAPWKRLMQLKQASMELAEHHHDVSLLRRSAVAWRRYARESESEREACAEQLHQHFLLRRSLNCWKRLRDARVIQEERAERFHRGRTLRRFLLALLDHVARERLAERDRLQRAREHSDRRLLWRCLRAWRRLPGVLRGERRRDERRERLSRKVAEVLLDFRSRPPREND